METTLGSGHGGGLALSPYCQRGQPAPQSPKKAFGPTSNKAFGPSRWGTTGVTLSIPGTSSRCKSFQASTPKGPGWGNRTGRPHLPHLAGGASLYLDTQSSHSIRIGSGCVSAPVTAPRLVTTDDLGNPGCTTGLSACAKHGLRLYPPGKRPCHDACRPGTRPRRASAKARRWRHLGSGQQRRLAPSRSYPVGPACAPQGVDRLEAESIARNHAVRGASRFRDAARNLRRDFRSNPRLRRALQQEGRRLTFGIETVLRPYFVGNARVTMPSPGSSGVDPPSAPSR
jgi:hypothetical protein